MTGKKWKIFKLLTVLLVLSALGCAVAGERPDSASMWTKLGIISFVGIAYLVMFISASSNLHSFVSEMETQLDVTERDSLYKFPAPAAVIDSRGVIIWYNKAFRNSICTEEAYGTNISTIADIDISLLDTAPDVLVEYTAGNYRIYGISTEKHDSRDNTLISRLSLLYFEDISDLNRISDEYRRSRTWVMLIMTDSYDDIFNDVKDSEKSHAIISIDKLIENFMEKSGGIYKKISSDRFFCIVTEEALQKMTEEKFRTVLEGAHAITLPDKSSVTLSIGVGRGGKTIAESERFAKQALDMTQGRGGDQAAIKDESDFTFFGGKSKGVEKRTKGRTKNFSSNVMNLAEQSDLVMVMGHKYSDFDSVGSAVGMCAAMRMVGKTSYVCIDTEKTLSTALINRLREKPGEASGEQDDIFMSPQDSLVMLTENTLLIIVDTSVEEQLECPELYHMAKNVVYIDHHRQSAECIKAVESLHEQYASSASEIVAEILQYMPLPSHISGYYADALLAGIMLDTKDFVNKTGVRTFEAAAYLRKLGANTVAVKQLFAISLESCCKRSKLIESAELHNRCAIATWDGNDPDVRIFSAQAADELLGTEEVDASFALYPCISGGEKAVKISARSFGSPNVQLIMEKIGGGGHQTMASSELPGATLAEAKDILIKAIDEYFDDISEIGQTETEPSEED